MEAALLTLLNGNLEMKSDGEEHLGSQTNKEAGAGADTRKTSLRTKKQGWP